MSAEVHNEHFDAWDATSGDVFGLVGDIVDTVGDTRLWAFRHLRRSEDNRFVIPSDGACYGYVQCGRAHVSDPQVDWFLKRGQWFVAAQGARIDFDTTAEETRVVVAQRLGFRACSMAGGPVESRGRLRYIDRCSDTLLAAPSRSGDPCLNLLHFPPGISQTFHVHPSVRAGAVSRGRGYCETPHGRTPLVAGLFFSIPANGVHRFVTESDAMDVIAYHPDSDWGPTDEVHPMLNRTLDPESLTSLAGDPDAQVASWVVGGC